jgi:glycosyltransferase involved in cell wall biosynthesis
MDNQGICVVTFPVGSAGSTPLANLANLLRNLYDNLTIISSKKFNDLYSNKDQVNIIVINHRKVDNNFIRPINYFLTQMKISWNIFRRCHDYNKCIFFLGGDGLIIPILFCKALNKEVILCLGGSTSGVLKQTNDLFYPIYYGISRLSYILTNKIILYSPCLISAWNLEPYKGCIHIAHEHFLDFHTFALTTPVPDRPPLIGYIGRLSGEKGAQNFAQALPAILSGRQDLRVLIGGDGPLKETIEASLQEGGLTARVDLPGWISHDNLPTYLNQLRLLVLPSYTEGLPNIMLEAMACGTPVLATPVGAIPDVIIDGKTGFIMEDNSPECIAANVMRALSSPDLEQIAEDGRRFVEENFSFESTVTKWKEVLEEI